jgi:hypothetical protein
VTRDEIFELRRALLANGYTPIPNVGKMTFLKGWPTVEVTEATLDEWRRRHSRWQDTGLRVQDGLAVIDLDIDHEVADDIADALEEAEPGLSQALLRFGKGRKRAWFLRTAEPFTRIHSRRWLAPDADIDRDGSQVVEIFGGASARQFGAFGAHTREPDGSIAIAYEWSGGTQPDGPAINPLNTPLRWLPELPKARFYELVDLVEQRLEAAGFQPVVRTTKGESEATRVYDLTDDMLFETSTGEVDVPFQQLRARRGEEGLRTSASFIEPGKGHSLTRCLVGTSHSGEITIWDSATGVTHMPVGADEGMERRTDTRLDLDRVAEKLGQLKLQRQTKPSTEDSALQVAGKLLQSYAWCPTRQLQVVPYWATSTEDGMSLTNFRTTMLPYAEIEIGPKGGEKKINPADLWVSSPQRVTVRGLQLRPDKERPVFEENGSKWVNTYDPEVHTDDNAAEGTATGGFDLLEQLLPEPSERAWFERWLAHKYRFPGIPGPAVVMVARQHGTGRGTLAELVRALFGGRYVKTIGFDHFAGRTYQSQYTAWQADSLITIVNESSTADSGSTYRTKHDTYERLKEIVDPRAQERLIIAHGTKAYPALVCTSYLIFTNNPDALPLPADDRRFWVGTNGEKREPEFWERINRWLSDPANIAAFARWLFELDLQGFDPYAEPPMTAAKAAMTDLSASDIDRAFGIALDNLPADLILPEQLIAQMRAIKDEWGFEYPDKFEPIVRRLAQRQLTRVGVKDGPGWVLRVDGKKYPVFARDNRAAGRWRALAGEDEFRREVLRNGHPSVPIATSLSKLHVIVDNKDKA